NKLLEKILFSPSTQRNLHQKLRLAQSRLKDAGDPDHVSSHFADDAANIRRMLTGILQGTQSEGLLLDSLLQVEANMVEQARGAGLKMAAFRKNQFTNPEQARQDLASFGQKLSEDFNAKLKNFAVETALLPLGAAIYAAGATALDPAADTVPSAMFRI